MATLLKKRTDRLKLLEAQQRYLTKKYERVLRIRKNESIEQWEERTKRHRYRCEEELKKLKAQVYDQNVKVMISTRKKEINKKANDRVYENKYRIILEVRKRPIVFFQNSMLILNFAELKYGIPKMDLLFLMNLYSEERGFTEEELKYKIHLLTNSTKRFGIYIQKGYFKQFIKKDFPGGVKTTDVYTLHVGITNLIDKLYLMMIGELSLNEFSYLRKKYPHIDNEFDILKQDIINMKTKFDNSEYIETVKQE